MEQFENSQTRANIQQLAPADIAGATLMEVEVPQTHANIQQPTPSNIPGTASVRPMQMDPEWHFQLQTASPTSNNASQIIRGHTPIQIHTAVPPKRKPQSRQHAEGGPTRAANPHAVAGRKVQLIEQLDYETRSLLQSQRDQIQALIDEVWIVCHL
jgi:hypothetical protein